MAKKAAKKTAKTAGKKTADKRAEPPAAHKIGQATDVESVRQLVRLMVNNGLTEIKIADGSIKVHLKRGPGGAVEGAPPASVPAGAGAPAPAPAQAKHPPTEAEADAEDVLEIKSPMVGTFYAAPSPEAEPYVAVGSAVVEDTVVCIVEAMKVMNEIKAECAGEVAEVCVKDAQPVEYGQTLFRVNPS